MTAAHLLLGALLEGTGPGDAMRGRRVRRCRSRARRSLLLLPEELLHGADVNLVLLLPHRQRPDVGLPAHLLLWYGLPEEAANSTLLPAVGGRGRGRRRRRRSWRRRRQGRRGRCWGPGVAGRISDGVRVSGHRGRGRGGGVGGGSGAAAPLAAAALWLIGCGRATHNKHPKTKQPAQVQRWLKKNQQTRASPLKKTIPKQRLRLFFTSSLKQRVILLLQQGECPFVSEGCTDDRVHLHHSGGRPSCCAEPLKVTPQGQRVVGSEGHGSTGEENTERD